jgi:subtilisin-like proprotein convertase family protein
MKNLLLIPVLLLFSAELTLAQEHDTTYVFYAYPNLFIPEEDTTGVVDTLGIPVDVIIEDLNVYIGIGTYRMADLLRIDVISPWADTVRLADSNPNFEYFNCWFDTNIPEDGPGQLEDYVGHLSAGQWIIQAAQWTGHMDFYFQSWAIEVVTHSTAIDDNPGDSLEFGMISTFPNPANSSIRFEFGLTQSGPATIEIYDILGRKVGIALNESLAAGRHAITWSATNTASGVYYYILTSGDHKSQGRITLLK